MMSPSGPALRRALLVLVLSTPHPAAARQQVAPRPCTPGDRGREIRGVVVDLLSRMPLPGSSVTLREPAEYVPQVLAVAEAGEGGHYAFCAPALGANWQVLASFDTIASRALRVDGEGGVDTLYLPLTAPVTLSGRVRQLGSDEPVPGARVEALGRPVRALTDDKGEFRLRGLGAGPLVIRTSALGLETRVDTLVAQSAAHLRLDIVMSGEVVQLPPLVVTASAPPSTRMRGIENLGMTPAQVEEALPRSIDFASMLRYANTPGLLVGEAGGQLCVAFFRSSGSCPMVEVFVNGIRMSDGAAYLAALDPSSVREFIILRPAFAQFQYMGPRTPNGVIDIILR
jgi:hypothetical protein